MDENDDTEAAHAEPGRAATPRAVLTALRAAIPGLEVVERDAELRSGDPALRADWVGTDAAGRVVLACLLDGPGAPAANPDDTAILRAVSLIACAGMADAAGTAERFQSQIQASGRDPLVVLILRRSSARVLAALALLPQEDLVLFELQPRTGGARARLVRRDPRAGSGRRSPASSGTGAWPPEARAIAESLAARMQRLDPSIGCHAVDAGLNWSWRDRSCAALTFSNGILRGEAAGAVIPIQDEAAAESWLEQALRVHCARLRMRGRVARPADLLARGGPLLTAEELAAFRD